MTPRFRGRFLVGVLLGLVASGATLPLFDGPYVNATKRTPVALVSDCNGSLGELVIHYVPEQINGRFLNDGPDFTPATQGRFDAVAAQCHAAGYHVVRIPIVPGRDGRTYLSYLNVIQDDRGDRRTVYLPVFRDAEALNEAAERVWKELGYEVCRVDSTACYPHFGTLRCLVNVLRRHSD